MLASAWRMRQEGKRWWHAASMDGPSSTFPVHPLADLPWLWKNRWIHPSCADHIATSLWEVKTTGGPNLRIHRNLDSVFWSHFYPFWIPCENSEGASTVYRCWNLPILKNKTARLAIRFASRKKNKSNPCERQSWRHSSDICHPTGQ